MPFIKKNQVALDGKTTRGLYIGKVEAEGETLPGQSLTDYFEDYLDINSAIHEGKFLIVGRKGVGKSAYVKYLCDHSSFENEMFCNVVKSNNIYLHKIIQSIPPEIENKYAITYEWIILTEFVKLLLSNPNHEYADGYDALMKFEEKNSGIVNVDKWMSVASTETASLDVHFYELRKWLPIAFSKQVQNSQSKAPFYKIIPSLREVVVKMLGYELNKGINYIVLFDDLDVDFKLSNDQQKKELMDLIRVARDYNTKYFPNENIKVILMLRDDIAMQLDGIASDKSKIFGSYEHKLQWYQSGIGVTEEHCLIRKFINKRIEIGLKKIGIETNGKDPWSLLVENDNSEYYHREGAYRTGFKYVLDYTFYRPRDLVALFKEIGKCEYKIPICPSDMKKLVRKYVDWNVGEIKDELSTKGYDSKQINDIFSVFQKVASGVRLYKDIISELNAVGLGVEDFKTLVYYSYLIPKDEWDRQYSSYREMRIVGDLANFSYTLPKCLYSYFR